MRQSRAREKIIVTARGMIGDVGYAALNVNEVAESAGVSIGTLYYHFPDGKVSILMEARKRIANEYEIMFRERLGDDFLDSVVSFDEGFEKLLDVLIELHREQKLVLAAMESEVLGNLPVYNRMSAEVDVRGVMMDDTKPILDVLRTLLDRFPVSAFSLVDGVRACKVMDILIHRYVFMEYIFGTEQEFKEMIKKIVKPLLF